MKDKFSPKAWIRNPQLQTILGSLKIRAKGMNPMVECSEEIIIDSGNGVRLRGHHSCQPQKRARGLVLLLHGWEGSSDSAYILSTGKYLFRDYDIFRLNLRDHGDSQHLNEGLFNSSLIEEVFNATQKISLLSKGSPLYIIGFSLGGNFALRLALWHSISKIINLKHVVCISPVLDPCKSCIATDNNSLIRNYFLKKWRTSLYKKQKLFPEIYDFSNIESLRTIMELTEAFVPTYTKFKDINSYFESYTLLDDVFLKINIPVTIITSKDDPIIPVEDFYNLRRNDMMRLLIQPYGGHNGFVDFFPFTCWYERRIYDLLNE